MSPLDEIREALECGRFRVGEARAVAFGIAADALVEELDRIDEQLEHTIEYLAARRAAAARVVPG